MAAEPIRTSRGSLRLCRSDDGSDNWSHDFDVEIDFADFALQGTDRWKLAASTPIRPSPSLLLRDQCTVTPQDAPRHYRMLQRVMADAGASTHTAKGRYRRPRPFMLNHAPTCFPAADNALRSSGSYPSGHTAIGWAWALVLSEPSPDQSEAILAWPRVQRKPPRLQRALGERRHRRPLHGSGHGRASARPTGVSRRPRSGQVRTGGRASQESPAAERLHIRGGSAGQNAPARP
jgi:hypothetical protein